MSETIVTKKIHLPADQLPVLPETHSIDPIVQCGVLYLGTAPSSAGFHGLDAVQEPFSHRYPVDGTNTVRGIDAVLSVYDNGIQLAFTRHPYAVIFFPISSLIYCASLRFSIVENDQTKPASLVDWRFMPLDTITNNENKHPPLFCAVIKRTQFLSGDECHCFITKSPDAATALVGTLSQIYANVKPGTKCLPSPIFYQLDRFGRKLSETTGIIYISPANDDDSQLNQITDESIAQNYLFDPSYDGFFYRTDASVIEQWQLWDDDNFIGSRPRPPASPFGLHEGIYHDDTTHEIQRYLRRMDDEEHSCSCSYSSSKSSSCTSSISTEYSRREHRHRSNEQKLTDDADQFDPSLSNLQTSSFEPVLTQNNIKTKKSRKKPIIIEKIVPKPNLSIPILNPKLPDQPLDLFNTVEESNVNYVPSSDYSTFSYRINEHGEKISNDGNRIVFMDVIQIDPNNNQNDSQSYIPPISHPRLHQKRSSKRVPIINIESIERLFNEKNSKNQQRTNINLNNKSKDQLNNTNHLTSSDQLETINQYLEDYHGNQMKSNDQTTIRSESSSEKKSQQSTNSSKSKTHHRHNHSILTVGPSVNYVEHPLITSLTQSQVSSQIKQNIPTQQILTNEKLNEYLSNIYGTTQSVKSSSSSTTHQDIKSLDKTAVTNQTYLSAFRYMQSSMNRNLFEEYRNAY